MERKKLNLVSQAQAAKEALKRGPWTLDKDRYYVQLLWVDKEGILREEDKKEYKLDEKIDFPIAKEGEEVSMFRLQDYSIDVSLLLPNGTRVKKLFVGIKEQQRVSYIGYKLEDSPAGVSGLELTHYFKDSKHGEDVAVGEERERFITKDMMPHFNSLLNQHELRFAYNSLKKGIEQLEVLPSVQNPNTVV